MVPYKIFLSNGAKEELDEIYGYIASALKEPGTAAAMVDEIETAILSLKQMPYRYPERQIGLFARKGYRQLIVKNYLVIYRVDEENHQVVVLTIRYAKRNF